MAQTFLRWQANFGRYAALLSQGDANVDSTTDSKDRLDWEAQFGDLPTPAVAVIPEPATCLLLLGTTICLIGSRSVFYFP